MTNQSTDQWNTLKASWTGRNVKVNTNLPKMIRFAEKMGIVITVNQNGKCLVDFHDGGWYDIEPEALIICNVMDQPPQQSATAGISIPVRQK